MDYGKAAAKMMRMDEGTWRRHSNPWSVWTRVPILPLLALAVYSRAWWGWWALAPTGLLIAWAWINPRIFPAPDSTDSWASKGTFGERVWLNRKQIPIPEHHGHIAHVLSAVSAAGVLALLYGLIYLNAWATVAGATVAAGAKLWFVDRMVWLYEDMKDHYPEMAAGEQPPAKE